MKDRLDEEMYPYPIDITLSKTVVFSYDVTYVVNKEKTHSSRWDIYMNKSSDQIQWISLALSSFIALLLTGIVALLIRLALRRDLIKYKVLTELPQAQELSDQGWK